MRNEGQRNAAEPIGPATDRHRPCDSQNPSPSCADHAARQGADGHRSRQCHCVPLKRKGLDTRDGHPDRRCCRRAASRSADRKDALPGALDAVGGRCHPDAVMAALLLAPSPHKASRPSRWSRNSPLLALPAVGERRCPTRPAFHQETSAALTPSGFAGHQGQSGTIDHQREQWVVHPTVSAVARLRSAVLSGTTMVLFAVALGVVTILFSIPHSASALAAISTDDLHRLPGVSDSKSSPAVCSKPQHQVAAPASPAESCSPLPIRKVTFAIASVFTATNIFEKIRLLDAAVKTALLGVMIVVIHLCWLWLHLRYRVCCGTPRSRASSISVWR